MEQSSLEIAKALGETNAEKTRAQSSAAQLKAVSQRLLETVQKITKEKENVEHQRDSFREMAIKLQQMEKTLSLLLSRIFPAPLKKDFISGRVEFQTHEITLLKIRIQGYPNIHSQSNPLQLVRNTRSFFTELHKIIIYFNGWLIKYINESIEVMFGVPYATRTHALDAVLCAWKIMEYTRKTQFKVCIGIHSGSAVIGDVGSPWRPQYDLSGEAADLAAKLELAAESGTCSVLLSDETRRRIAPCFETESMPKLHLPGVGYREVWGLKGFWPVDRNPFRVPSNSKMAKNYRQLSDYIQERRNTLFKKVDLTKIELKDGAIGQGEAIAFYALALSEKTGADADKDRIISAAFLMNSGKLLVKRSILNKPQLSDEEAEFVRNLAKLSVQVIDQMGKFSELKDLILETGLPYSKIMTKEGRLLKIASVFEGMSFPKHYKDNPGTIDSARKLLRQTVDDDWSRAFLNLLEP